MTLPVSRNETATAANPVASNLINAIQDCIIGMKRPPFQIPIHSSAGQPITACTYNTAGYLLSSGAGEAQIPIVGLMAGDRIVTIDAFVFGNAVNNLVWALNKMVGATGVVSIPTGGNDTSVVAAAWTKRTVTLNAGGYVIPAGTETYFIDWLPAATAMRFGGFVLNCDHP